MGGDIVIRVDEGDVVAFRLVDAGITGIAQTTVLLVDHLYALVLASPFVTDTRTFVRRAVIDEDEFEVIKILMYHTLYTSLERGLYTVDRDDNSQFHTAKVDNLFGNSK